MCMPWTFIEKRNHQWQTGLSSQILKKDANNAATGGQSQTSDCCLSWPRFFGALRGTGEHSPQCEQRHSMSRQQVTKERKRLTIHALQLQGYCRRESSSISRASVLRCLCESSGYQMAGVQEHAVSVDGTGCYVCERGCELDSECNLCGWQHQPYSTLM